jgi:hypothetical protein
MAGDLSYGLVDGLGHCCWPIWRGRYGRLRQKASEIAAGKSETHCSLCKAFFGFADGV